MGKSVMLIMGSHRKHKNTAFFSERLRIAFEERAFEVSYFDVNDLKIEHCTDCGYCSKHFSKCVFEDDMNSVYEAFKTSKHVIFVSPVYMNNITSKLKLLVDRCQMIFMCKYAHNESFVLDTHVTTAHEALKGSEQSHLNRCGTGIIVSLGGARSYENQYVGSELTLDLIFNNLSLPLKKHIQFSGTDHVTLEGRLEEVDAAIELIVNEVIKNESKI
ncbi:flavodoxin family protein [Fusibacter ferrireducens]|uniref:Flavodoxin family protein n=1 Tax=Fusibacter ferrireducens TaxID=2785058 RepID=A0ABR9ZR96_9FIRM|nr:flavodoxin family protein [Fusibacter ferrireducens]MBF4692982.1 flavodoxin family protein [Fusibacter ferrireducens]